MQKKKELEEYLYLKTDFTNNSETGSKRSKKIMHDYIKNSKEDQDSVNEDVSALNVAIFGSKLSVNEYVD